MQTPDQSVQITKEEAIAAFGSDRSVAIQKLADALGCTRAAIYGWKDGAPIPEKRALSLRFVLKPMHPWGKKHAEPEPVDG